jgi:hypothetical protein
MAPEQSDTLSMPTLSVPTLGRRTVSRGAVCRPTLSMSARLRATAVILVQMDAVLLSFIDERYLARWTRHEIRT